MAPYSQEFKVQSVEKALSRRTDQKESFKRGYLLVFWSLIKNNLY
jgi:hypothetical protein